MLLDHVENLELTDEDADKHYNELLSLAYLSTGLSFLDNQVRKIEEEFRRGLPGSESGGYYYGFHPNLDGVPQGFVACCFHWYSVTVCNYVRLVGWLINGQNPKRAKEYVETVIPEVYNWRNKVGAHFAQSDPLKSDTPAVLAWSVMFPIGFDGGTFYTDPVRVTRSSGERQKRPSGIDDWRWRYLAHSGRKIETSPANMKWSLTQVHGGLSSRYGFPLAD